jgi:ribosome-binding ATPase
MIPITPVISRDRHASTVAAHVPSFTFWSWSSLKSGIIGARGAGKTTVFHALTGLAPIAGKGDAKNRARPGQIKVADPRLDFLEAAYGSKKKVPVELTIYDFAPAPRDQKEGAALDPTLLPLIRDLDALLIVIPEFIGRAVPILEAIESVESELVFADFDQAERRLERLKKEKGPVDFERGALAKCIAWLEQGKPLRTLEMTAQELQAFASFGFLSRKPALAVINCDADHAIAELPESERAVIAAHGFEVFRLAAAFEAELWELDNDTQIEFLKEAGLERPARERLITALYQLLGLITFYTAGEPEAHAWPLNRGANALEAAGRIHSDIARGFIRAEVVGYEDFAELRSDAKVKEAGKLRLEGRDYLMRDGDIIHVRFKV